MNHAPVIQFNSSLLTVNTIPKTTTRKRPVDLSLQLVSMLVHEVRNPLTNITLSVEMMRRLAVNDGQEKYLDIITRGADRINSLVNELLNYQQLKKTVIRKHNLHELVDEVLDIVADRLAIKKITVCKDYMSENFEFSIDKTKMKIALTNIIVNAIESMKNHTGELQLTTRKTRGKHALIIHDNGCGIKQEDLKKIFSLYYTNKPGGLGVGLSLTKKILRSNHVALKVESKLMSGTSFILEFDERSH